MTHAEYEYENQEDLKYLQYLQVTGRATEYATVRRIICKGCERVYFTQVHCVKFCYHCQQGNVGAMYVSIFPSSTETVSVLDFLAAGSDSVLSNS